MASAQIIPFPSRSDRLQQSDELIKRWLEIQATLDGPEKIAAMFDWRQEVFRHAQAHAIH